MKKTAQSPELMARRLRMMDPHHPVFEALDEVRRWHIRALAALKQTDPGMLLEHLQAAQTRLSGLQTPPDTPHGKSIEVALSSPPLVTLRDCTTLLESIGSLLARSHPPGKSLGPPFDPLTSPHSVAGWRHFKVAATRYLSKAGLSPAQIAEIIEGCASTADVERTRSRLYRKD